MSAISSCQSADGLEKKTWPNKAAAAFVAHCRAQDYGYPLAIYLCPECGRWHVTKNARHWNQDPKNVITGKEAIASIVALR